MLIVLALFCHITSSLLSMFVVFLFSGSSVLLFVFFRSSHRRSGAALMLLSNRLNQKR